MLTLPAPDRRPLPNAALSLVVTQVRFDARADAVSGEVLEALRGRLDEAGHRYTQMDQLSARDLIVGPAGPIAETSAVRKGWRLATPDNRWQLSLLPDSLSVETAQFETFDEMLPRVTAALDALSGVDRPTVVTRVGLRFINQLESPHPLSGIADWRPWLAPALHGALADDTLRDGVVAAEQRMVLAVDDFVRSAVRSGPLVHDGETARYLLDIDSFVEMSELWRTVDLPGLISRLNDVSVSVFQHLLSPRMISYLQGHEGGES
ncbi:TIGR04255 family protein [Jatrophihabitans cynanchi]|uniref:TIGR04255 family protein n=1 Tax=Jatrophihabitans cynanchi TaxID=2944128 RepID=A0ABY7JSJ9_9ACTN|nr:TIGR04255 family protein [Jatrophihabitans sp. SB3-54]WAX55541.1 TIGR04255 family protein [Jatrophihabitans sp. SB3-54]